MRIAKLSRGARQLGTPESEGQVVSPQQVHVQCRATLAGRTTFLHKHFGLPKRDNSQHGESHEMHRFRIESRNLYKRSEDYLTWQNPL